MVMNKFNIVSDFQPTGDQPEAISQLVDGLNQNLEAQTLLGVTGSGKTFTIANVIERVNRPTLILSHNKTLAAQLYGEFKQFFPDNRVEYFVSYYDYYQPEAFIPSTNTYIEKDLAINSEIEKLRLAATSALLSGRRDIVVVSSVSCIYGIGNPEDFHNNVIKVEVGQRIARNVFLRQLVDSLYSRNDVEFNHGNFRVKGDTIDIFVADADFAYRIVFWGDDIESIEAIDPFLGHTMEVFTQVFIYPAKIFVTSKERIQDSMKMVHDDLMLQIAFFKEIGKFVEAKRIDERVNYDLEMIRELGHCSGIENYSRYFDGREPGARPFCLLDYFPDDFLMVIDESHVTLPQIKAMYGGDRSRKTTLVEHGFRLPAALDNRPLKFEEFESIVPQVIYVSATPTDYELQQSGGVVVEQVIRPTGLLDPVIMVRPSLNQIDDLMEEIRLRVEKDERALVTTLTKRMAEELTEYLGRHGVRCNYIHSDVDTLERVKIMEGLRNGLFDVLVGVNLLREGLDLPEVSFVAILDADKEGFLRSTRALTQTAGRAARNVDGCVVMYADRITDSMQRTIDETNRRREKQLAYNDKNNITPRSTVRSKNSILPGEKKENPNLAKAYSGPKEAMFAADPVVAYMDEKALLKMIKHTESSMLKAAKELDFMEAARCRDELAKLKDLLKKKAK